MKLIEANNRTATLQLSRAELADNWKAVSLALGIMLEQGIKDTRDERFLPRVQALQQRLGRIALQLGLTDSEHSVS
jgi:hypothetical protein